MSKIVGKSKAVIETLETLEVEAEKVESAKGEVVKEVVEFEEKKAARKKSDKAGGVRSEVESLKERCKILFHGGNVSAIERYLNENASSMDGRERYEILMSVIEANRDWT